MILGGLDKTQPEISSQLDELAVEGLMPNALLFSGSVCSGRMFAARQMCKKLQVPSENTIIVSDRNHSYRIKTALGLYRKARNRAAREFLKENVSIMLQQFHGALMDSQSAAGKKKFSDASEVSELLNDIDSVSESDADKYCDKLEKAMSSLIDNYKTSSLSVGQVRAIRDWCNTSSMDGQQKMVIIEGLENSNDSAINALLKTLEEPPAGTRFILISANSGKIPATILSRVRKFRFKELGENEKKYILSNLFVNPNEYSNLEAFFLKGSGINDSLLEDSARKLLMKEDMDLPALVKELESNQGWDRFFYHVIEQIRTAFLEGRLEHRRAQYLMDSVNDVVLRGKVFNQTKRLTFEYVVFRIREVNR